jgi:hypothetical protein
MHDELVGVWEFPMVDSKRLRATASDLTIKARAAASNEEKLALAARAKSYLLLAKNAEWLTSTDEFLKAIEKGKRWPHPTAGVGHTFS